MIEIIRRKLTSYVKYQYFMNKKLTINLLNACLALICIILLLGCESPTKVNNYAYNTVKEVKSKHGAVVSAHALASQVGIKILRSGGNAIDAAIATQFALAVVYPGAGNIGGGGFSVIHLKDGRNITIDFRETAPLLAARNMYLDSLENPVPNLSLDGHLSSGVPGSVAGIFEMMKYASLPLHQIIQPAIDLAEFGFAITASEAESLNQTKGDFVRLNTVKPVFVKDVEWKAGDTLIQKDLANTLKRIRDNGANGFYEGETARLIVEEMKRGKGLIGYEDLKNYKVVDRAPMEFNYRGYNVITMPMPSSGGIILEQLLKMSEMKNISSFKYGDPNGIQLMVELERRAFADRAQYLGDPDFVKVPVKTLTSTKYLEERLKSYVPGKAGNSKEIKMGIIPESEETTHFNVLDRWGNAVSITTTLNGHYGSRTVVGGAGFLLNNEMDDFSVKPGVPNMYGAVGQEANSIAPNKRMLSSMTPTIVLKNNKPWIVVGTPGGTTIPTSVYQTIVNIIDFNLPANDAVNFPKFHHQWLPDIIFMEDGFPNGTKNELKNMGYSITPRTSIGRTELIYVMPDKTYWSIADHRGDDAAAGY